MSVQVTIQANDSSTGQGISGASVFVDGVNHSDTDSTPLITNGNGMISFTLGKISLYIIDVTATGYADSSINIPIVSSSVPSTYTVLLVSISAPTAPINMTFVPGIGGITWSLATSTGAQIDNGYSDPNGNAASNVPLIQGATYSLTATASGYISFNQSFTVTGQTDPYQFVLVAASDSGSTPIGNTTPVVDPSQSSILSQAITSQPDSIEFIYPNTDYDKYFTITGARIFIGNLFIDELSSIQYALQDNAIPTYGYASRFVDAYAQGRSLVQGQFSLNFVSEGYLYTVLQQYSNLQGNGFNINSPQANQIAQILTMMATRDSLIQQANNNPNAVQPSNSSSTTAPGQGLSSEDIGSGTAVNQTQLANNLLSQIYTAVAALSSDQQNKLFNLREQQLKGNTNINGIANAVYEDILFDIRLTFGNSVTGVERLRYIEKCKLISNEQFIAPDGQTLLDSYGFIARRLR